MENECYSVWIEWGIQVFPVGSVGWTQGVWTGGPGLDPYCWLGVGWQRGRGTQEQETSHTKGEGSWGQGGHSTFFHAD